MAFVRSTPRVYTSVPGKEKGKKGKRKKKRAVPSFTWDWLLPSRLRHCQRQSKCRSLASFFPSNPLRSTYRVLLLSWLLWRRKKEGKKASSNKKSKEASKKENKKKKRRPTRSYNRCALSEEMQMEMPRLRRTWYVYVPVPHIFCFWRRENHSQRQAKNAPFLPFLPFCP